MKITAKQYALAFAWALRAGIDVKVAAENLAKILFSRQQLSLGPQIIGQLEKIYDTESGAIAAQVVSARPLSRQTEILVADYLRKITRAQEVKIKPIVDKDILGGLIIKYNDKILDGSLKGQIRSLKQKLTNN